MNLSLMPDYIYQQFAANGKMLSGGTIYFYQSGTFTPQSVFADAAGTTPLGTSVTLSASGTAVIFLGPGAYRIWVKDANGVQVAPYVDGILGTAQSGLIGSNSTFGAYKIYSDVRALTIGPDFVYVTGGTAEGDGGAGWFQLQPSSSLVDDGGTILTAASGSLVYKRVFDGYLDPQWYGVVLAYNVDQTARLNVALAASAALGFPLFIPKALFIAQSVTVPTGASVVTGREGYVSSTYTINLTFPVGTYFDGEGVSFGGTIQPVFGVGVCEQIKLSWMGASSDEARWAKLNASAYTEYSALADISTTVGGVSIYTRENFALDFTGGAVLTVNAAATIIDIRNLVYSGIAQIIKFNDIAYVGSVGLGTSIAMLEWFGFLVGPGPTVDNSIAFKAGAAFGNLLLRPNQTYFVKSTGSPYTLASNLAITGQVLSVLQIEQAITLNSLSLSSLALTGAGTITVTTVTTLQSVSAVGTNVITTAYLTIKDSASICMLATTNPAAISNSSIQTINSVGVMTASTLTAFSGSFHGPVRDSLVTATGAVAIATGTVFEDTSFSSSITGPLTKFSGSIVTFSGCDFALTGPIHYGTSTTSTLKFIECTSSDGWSNAVSNGYAIIDWQNSIPVQNSSFTFMNGCSLLRQINLNTALSPCVATSELLTHWRGALGSSTQSGTQITIAADTVIDSSFASTNTIRFYGTVPNTNLYAEQVNAAVLLVKRYGGIVVAKFDLPVASNVGFAPRLHVVQPYYLLDGSSISGWTVAVDSANCAPYHYAPNSGSIIIQADAWVGQRDIIQGDVIHNYTDQWGDIDLHYEGGGSEPINNLMFVITNEGSGNLPAGTKITLTIYPNLPDGIANYLAFFPLPVAANYIGTPDGSALLTHAQVFRNCDFSSLQVYNAFNSNAPGAIPVTG